LLQLPAGFAYFNPTSDKLGAPEDRNVPFEKKDIQLKDKTRFPSFAEIFRSASNSTSGGGSIRSSDGSIRGAGSFRASSSSSWIEVPPPLKGWTQEEQQIFMDILHEFPKAGRNPTHLELALVKAKKKLPVKTAADCHQCFKHLQASRVAYFGKKAET
jgi:hypothetical protein